MKSDETSSHTRGVTRILSQRRPGSLIIHYLRMRAIRHARKRHAGKCGGVKEVENAIECQVFLIIILISSRRYVFLGCPDTRSLGLIPRHNVINYSSRLKSEEATASSASMLVTPLHTISLWYAYFFALALVVYSALIP